MLADDCVLDSCLPALYLCLCVFVYVCMFMCVCVYSRIFADSGHLMGSLAVLTNTSWGEKSIKLTNKAKRAHQLQDHMNFMNDCVQAAALSDNDTDFSSLLLDLIMRSRVVPTSATFHWLMLSCQRKVAKLCNNDNAAPSALSSDDVRQIMRAEQQRAVQLKRTMEGLGLRPSRDVYEILVSCFMKTGYAQDVDKAMQILEMMKNDNVKISRSIWCSTVASAVQVGSTEQLARVLKECEDAGVDIDDITRPFHELAKHFSGNLDQI